eukprot:6664304-Heterocapsa_arctica.AAC.1
MALRAILRRAQAPREPAVKRPRRTSFEPQPEAQRAPETPDPSVEAPPESPQGTGPIRRYRVTNEGH